MTITRRRRDTWIPQVLSLVFPLNRLTIKVIPAGHHSILLFQIGAVCDTDSLCTLS